MTEKLETIEASLSAQEAAMKMRDRNVSSLVVIDANSKTVGIITERDLVRKVCVHDASSRDNSVRDIMSDALVTTDAISEVGVAADIMIQNQVRHLLVVKDDDINKPLGIITPSDLARYLKENLDIDDVNATIIKSLIETEKD
ncbi:MAG: CBS domain-containing protein [Thaumarchaeota archaeon]|nr:MAG: CBS domain-containing protein [Nitrososphaerota archaeon]